MKVLLVSLYELGRQPLALAWPVAFLRRAGFEPECLDVSVEPLGDETDERFRRADLVAVSVPMHTALRLGVRVAERVKRVNPAAHLCFFGLYAPLHEPYLRRLGVDTVLGGEAEEALVALARGLAAPAVTLRRLPFIPPERDLLPPLRRYARLRAGGEERLAGHVEATRGCKHLCRHCPIPSVYGGRFFAVPVEVVVEDARRQLEAGARHITFGDPDFLNGPAHALAVARALHALDPEVTFDATVKVAHLLDHREVVAELAGLGCVFLVSAVESLSDRVLAILDKGHTRADVAGALRVARGAGISLRPTFLPFTPWTTREDYLDLCRFVVEEDLLHEVDPIQLALRLLVPPGSLLADRPELAPHLAGYDEARLGHLWRHPDPAMDELQRDVAALAEEDAIAGASPLETFARIFARAGYAPGPLAPRRPPPPRLTEPWFC